MAVVWIDGDFGCSYQREECTQRIFCAEMKQEKTLECKVPLGGRTGNRASRTSLHNSKRMVRARHIGEALNDAGMSGDPLCSWVLFGV